jgi:cyclic lactone autoinducer peptide
MKNLNSQTDRQVPLMEKITKGVCDRLANMAAEPRGCMFIMAYEPKMPPELIKAEMARDGAEA